jgi:hypothetical protein
MTPEAFVQFLRRGPGSTCTAADGMQLAELVAPWTEAERRLLSKATIDFYGSPLHPAVMGDYRGYLQLAVLAVAPWSVVRKPTFGFFHNFEEAATKILIDRRPEWLERWVDARLNDDFAMISWHMLHQLVQAEACPKPATDGYVRLFAAIDGPWNLRNERMPRSERLLANSELIADVWRLFEVETTAFYIDVTQPGDRVSNNYEDWHATLLRLCELGHLDRQRLMDSCLKAIGGDFSASGLTGYVRFHARLSPTMDELAQREAVYLDLLSNRHPPIVSFALDQLASLQKAERLDGAAFLAAAGSVFALKPKGQPQQVLSLAARFVKASPELLFEAANLAIEALTHESSDVQAAAARLLEGWSAKLHRDHASELRDKLAGLEATVRPRIEAIIQQLAPQSSAAKEAPSKPATQDWSEWKARVEALDPQWRSLSGASDALACAESDCLYSGSWFNINYIPVLTSCAPIEPIESVDELLDAVAHALEDLESADELERILDGISRLCDQRPDDFELRAGPLLKRLTDEYRGGPGSGILSILGMSAGLKQLLLRWLGGKSMVRSGHVADPRSLSKFIDRRLYEIEQRVVARRSAFLLCAPTHEHGWLAPRVFVERLGQYANGERDPPLADLIQALLRLAPDHRSHALAAAGDLPDDWGPAVRFALGDKAEPVIRDDHSFSLWLAAGRSRHAYGPLEDLASAAGAARAPLLVAPRFVWGTEPRKSPRHFEYDYAVSLHVDAEPELSHHPANELRPTLLVRESSPRHWGMFGQHWSRAWQEEIWPANLDAVFVEAIHSLRLRVNMPASAFEPNHLYLRPLLQCDRPWNELAYLAVWVALLSKDPGSRGMAIDVIIAAIEDGRAQLQVDVLLKLAQGSWVKLKRLADAAREIARVSPRHAWWIAELLVGFVAALKSWSTDVQHLLALLLELFTELQLGLDDCSREQLQAIKATGKSAKLLNSLLSLTTSPSSPHRTASHEQALQSGCERAERWMLGEM